MPLDFNDYWKKDRYRKDDIEDVLLSMEDLGKHSKEVANTHHVSARGKSTKSLLHRLDNHYRVIVKVYQGVNSRVKEQKEISPASQWLLDNFYKIEEQYKDIRQNMIKERFFRLKALKQGSLKGYPRIYAAALELVSHTDGRLDEEIIQYFFEAYQSQQVLTISEIWALSLMLRLALIEKLRLVCEKILVTETGWNQAEELLEQSKETILVSLKQLFDVSDKPNGPLIEHLLRLLRRKSNERGMVVGYIEERLKEHNTTIESVIEEDHRQQASRKVSIGNAIISLNLISVLDWESFFESLNITEGILRKERTGIYRAMDFESRDYYRTVIEKIAEKYHIPEAKVARAAVDLSEAGRSKGEKYGHVGYYLVGEGKGELFNALEITTGARELKQASLVQYLGPIMAITLLITGLLMSYAYKNSENYPWVWALVAGLITVIPASEVGVFITNRILTKLVPPDFIPRLEYSQGIPPEARTLVVIPALINDEARAGELLGQLEVYYLSNREDNIVFGLAGDFPDTGQKQLPGEVEQVKKTLAKVKALNEKYGKEIFYYFHRERQYLASEKKWMGWERKRGALLELNQLLAGNSSSYRVVSGNPSQEGEIKYVITLDADTRLPIDGAKRLIGMISHPLNKATIDSRRGIVTQGYGLIQPRIDLSVESANTSIFTRIYAGQGGIDPYTTAASDIYQDLFHEAIFTGKGIYSLEVFNTLLKDAIPDQTILSHDLLEGSYVRTGLASDMELIDDYPAKYSSYISRLHRWVRGDWQLLPWLFNTITDRKGERVPNPLSSLSKWKIIDNLRRSLVSISLMLLLGLGISLLPGSWLPWVALGGLTLFLPFLVSLIDYFRLKLRAPVEGLWGNFGLEPKRSLCLGCLQLITLPHQAYMMVDAIVRTLYRLYFSRKRLLEWVTVADSEKKLSNDLKSYIQRMRTIFPVTIVAALFWLVKGRPIIGFPILILWLISPWVAYGISQPQSIHQEALDDEDQMLLRRIARKTWSYYEDLVGESDHYLPPDNYQEYPPKGAAHRTSPTNIGFYLLSVICARDLGYLTTTEMVKRVRETMNTLLKMETWKGHLYNWYDTRSLEVLRPHYVSTVDSGNFVAYLITLRESLEEYLNRPLMDKNQIEGLRDALLSKEGEDKLQRLLIYELMDREEITLKAFGELLKDLTVNGTDGCPKEYKRQLEAINTEFEIYLKPLTNHVKQIPCLNKLMGYYEEILDSTGSREDYQQELENIKRANQKIKGMIQGVKDLIKTIDQLVDEVDFTRLYDPKRRLFSIGYNVEEEKLTNSYYDLLASEVRTTSYIAIARRAVPKKHWYKLGRAFSVVNGKRSLVSWTGTMFEYFMPYLIMKNYQNTLLDETYHAVMEAQRHYGRQREVPWGISESGYYGFDLQLNYQYKAFGVPHLGLKRGLMEEVVVSPYSTLLALPYRPRESVENVKALINMGMEGTYGLYEAIDFTHGRLRSKNTHEIVKSFMAHHLGMGFVSLTNYFHDMIVQKRFHQNPLMRSGELLLQEKIPVRGIITKEFKEPLEAKDQPRDLLQGLTRTYGISNELPPKCHLLSNGDYSLLLTEGGSGYSRMGEIQITRWRQDELANSYGTFIFIHQLSDNKNWATGYDPFKEEPDGYQVSFSQDRVEYIRNDDTIQTHTEILVSPEDPVEIRRVTLTNYGAEPVTLQVTSYFETVLGDQRADVAHPAFSNLFVRTELLSGHDCLLASRRPREPHLPTRWLFHSLHVEGEVSGGLQYETNRGNFLGRGRDLKRAVALNQPLKNYTGIAIDPIMSLRKTIRLKPGESGVFTFTTGIQEDREMVIELMKKYHGTNGIERARELALTRSQVELTYLNFKIEEISIFQELIPYLIYLNPGRRKYEEILKKNKKGQSGLWAYGVSGDLPIFLVTIKKIDEIEVVKECIRAHEYWRTKGLKVDLIILNEDESSYLQPLQHLINEVVFTSNERHLLNQPGGIFIRDANVIPPEDRNLIYTAARALIKGEGGALSRQLSKLKAITQLPPAREFKGVYEAINYRDIPVELTHDNGYGGFSSSGREYIIKLKDDLQTPAPWSNVIANENFGFLVTENGSGYTWAENSRENKLTPWSNDPVTDPPGELLYLQEKDSGAAWTITPLPIREPGDYVVKHGMGYTSFIHHSHDIEQELTLFVPERDPVKIYLVKLKNTAVDTKKLMLTFYMTPVLGVSDEVTRQYILTELNGETGGIKITNPFQSDFPDRIAFIESSERVCSYTGNKNAFFGARGDRVSPDALGRVGLNNELGGGLNPCGALQCEVVLPPGEEKDLVFLLGQVKEASELLPLINQYKTPWQCRLALKQVQESWNRLVGKIQVKTPDPSMDLMLNGWLLYQSLVCRLWGRSAFYQSGGAYGYRDQLQDAYNLLHPAPELLRKQILLHCQHQFVEGDVQHWWHPGAGEKGIRTRFSDDLLWLPFTVAAFYHHTQDETILKEKVHFLEDEPLAEGEDERYGIPRISEEQDTVYGHCLRAIDRSLRFGSHGIPLMGSGDWNDGMSTVGNKGKGESIWLGWFLYKILKTFAPICGLMGDQERKETYLKAAENIVKNIEAHAWDGNWYMRAFFDDGRPLGSSQNEECMIDSLAQSWSIISEGGNQQRAKLAMEAVEDYLIKDDAGLILLFTPPFDESDLEPGYIKGYVPGVRENGGQYTHAAAWVIKAFAMMGDGDRAWELFRMINPINHTRTPLECAVYRVEPYVMAADVYAVEPHVGRGGWTWYTGVAGWMYRVGIEDILGLKRHGNRLYIRPSIPVGWPGYEVTYQFGTAVYHIIIHNTASKEGPAGFKLDERPMEGDYIELKDDGRKHRVELWLEGK